MRHTENKTRKSIQDDRDADQQNKGNGPLITNRGAAFTSKSRNNKQIKQRIANNVQRSRKAKRNRRYVHKTNYMQHKRSGHQRSRGQTYVPEINQRPPYTRCFRYEYENNGPNTFTFTNDDLINALGFVINTSTAFYPLYDSFKLLRIGISILPRDSTAGFTMFGIRWQGQYAPDVLDTMVVGNAFPSHRNFYPYEDSLANFWQDQPSTVQNMFEFNIDANGATIIMDLEMELVLGDGSVPGTTLTNASVFTGIAARVMPATGPQVFFPVLLNSAY